MAKNIHLLDKKKLLFYLQLVRANFERGPFSYSEAVSDSIYSINALKQGSLSLVKKVVQSFIVNDQRSSRKEN